MKVTFAGELEITFLDSDHETPKEQLEEAYKELARCVEEYLTIPGKLDVSMKFTRTWSDDPDAGRVNVVDTWRK